MSDLRTAAQQALDSINELFAAEQSEGGERGGHIRTPATREHLVRVAQARKALHESCGALRAALAQQAEPTVTEDMKSAVRWAPSSAYWSQRLREFFGPDAREGIDALERRLAKAQQAEPASVAAAMRDARLNAGWSQQAEPLNLADPAVRKRLASQWGYVPAAAQAEPVEPVDPVAVVATQSDVWRGYNGQWAPPGKPIKMVQMLRDLPMGTLLYTAPPKAEPVEPVAEVFVRRDGVSFAFWLKAPPPERTKLYTAPPQRKLLTEEEKRALADKFLSCQPESYEVSGVFDLISAVERAHGIKE